MCDKETSAGADTEQLVIVAEALEGVVLLLVEVEVEEGRAGDRGTRPGPNRLEAQEEQHQKSVTQKIAGKNTNCRKL